MRAHTIIKGGVTVKRWWHRKVTPEMKKDMDFLRGEGLTQKEIGEKLRVSQATVCYHLNVGYRKRKIEYEKTRPNYNKKKGQFSARARNRMRRYLRDRYQNDPEFRERMKGYVREYARKARMKTRERTQVDPVFAADRHEYIRLRKREGPKVAWAWWHEKHPGWRPV